MFWLGLITAIAIAALYIFIVRPILATQPAFSVAFKAEASFWQKLQAEITGWRTKIAARLMMITGSLVGLYDYLVPVAAGQDWSPITRRLPDWVVPVGMVAIGWLFHWLRSLTENPPQVITQKDDTGTLKVIEVIPPVK